MVDKADSDVERALAAFGASTLKYRNFGTFEPKPGHDEVPPALVSADDSEYDPFVVAMPTAPLRGDGRGARDEGGAGDLYPLIGAAVPESAHRHRGEPDESERLYAGNPARAGFDGDDDVHDAPSYLNTIPPRTRVGPGYVPPPSDAPQPAYRPSFTPVAERGWVPPVPEPQMYDDPPEPYVAPPPPVAAPPPVAPPPFQPAPSPAPGYVAPPVAPAPVYTPPPPIPLTSLAAHLAPHAAPQADRPARSDPEHDQPEPAAPLPVAPARDHRSLAEMFLILTTVPEPEPEPEPEPVAEPEPPPPEPEHAEEPGLFRRL